MSTISTALTTGCMWQTTLSGTVAAAPSSDSAQLSPQPTGKTTEVSELTHHWLHGTITHKPRCPSLQRFQLIVCQATGLPFRSTSGGAYHMFNLQEFTFTHFFRTNQFTVGAWPLAVRPIHALSERVV